MQKDIDRKFSKTAETRQILNYVWLANAPSADTNNPIPESYARNAARIARENPETQILLWVDKKLHTDEALKKLNNFADTSNIKIMDLNDIDFYVRTPLFQKREKDPHDGFDPLWQKVDLVRIAVVDHILRTSPEATSVFYSDLDIVNPQISEPKTQNILKEHGMVFAFADLRGTDIEGTTGCVENQFFGFTHSGASFVSDTLLPETLCNFEKPKPDEKPKPNGYYIFEQCVYKRFKDIDPELKSVTIVTQEIRVVQYAQKLWVDVLGERTGRAKG